jgi:16S rRNA (cytosine967-C5)-methyltransferase
LLTERKSAHIALCRFFEKGILLQEAELSPFALELAMGVCRRHLFLEYVLKKQVKKMPALKVSLLLEMGVYQLFFMDSVPEHAALHTTVELAKEIKCPENQVRFVNGVLRNILRQGLPELPSKRIKKISIKNSIPEWLVKHWVEHLGINATEKYAEKHLKRPVFWLRCDTRKIDPKSLAKNFGFSAEIYKERYLKVPDSQSLKILLESKEFLEGLFSVQNPAAVDVISLLKLEPSLKVWDACAAPGGKTAFMAELEPTLEILATDISEKRLLSMQDLFSRLCLKNVKTACLDASEKIPSEKFQRILLDVPCSNLGVLPARPEAVYRVTQNTLKELASLQSKILENASKALASGGILVYATCSPEFEETENVIQQFLQKHSDFEPASEPLYSGKLHPDIDSFFAQALRRKE